MFSRAWLQEVCSAQETSRESERNATAPSVSAAGAGQRRPAACASRLRSAEHAVHARVDGEGRRGRALVATANVQCPRTSTQCPVAEDAALAVVN